MLRTVISRPILAIAVAVIWTAAIIGFTMAQEAPTGSIKGKVVSAETNRAIDGAHVTITREVKPGSNDWEYKSVETDENGIFQFSEIPIGKYKISAHGKAHSLDSEKILVHEGRVEAHNMSLEPTEPYLRVYVNQHMFTTKEKPQIVLDGFTKDEQLKLTLYRINADKLLTSNNNTVLDMLSSGYGSDLSIAELENNPVVESKEDQIITISTRDSEGVYHEKITLLPNRPGIYIVTVKANGFKEMDWVSISDISLVTKDCGLDMLTYVATSDTGEPIPGAEIKVYQGKNTIDGGFTGENGIWQKTLTKPKGGAESRLIVARKGDSVALLSSYAWEPGASAFSLYTYTDRPVYRPGQQVHFKGIVRKFENDHYTVPAQGEAQIEVRDRRSTIIYKKSLPLSRFGSFQGEFFLPEFAATGNYDINCSYGGKTETASFSVAEYRKPEYTVSIEMPKRCVRGERVKAKVKTNYYFGAPVSNAEIRYSVSRSYYWFWPDSEDSDCCDWSYEDYGDYGEYVTSGVARTREDGTAEIEFTANWDSPKDSYSANDQEFTVTAYVTDQSGREVESEGSIIATQGEFKVAIESQRYVCAPHENVHFTIIASDYDNRPISGAEMYLTANITHWEKGKEAFEPMTRRAVQTDSRGRAAFDFAPSSPGNYAIRVECKDRKGNQIKASGWIWVSGDSEYTGYAYPDLEIVLDKKVYNPGDTARVMVNSKAQGVLALVTVEGRRLFDYKQVRLTGKSTVVEIPIKPEYRPNFFINACYIKNKKFAQQEGKARVSLKEKTISVTVTPDKKRYQPRDRATYLIKTVDDHGKPVQAEVSLGVVDESIYAIQEDSTTSIRDFFYARQYNSVNTNYSFPEVYLSGDKAGYAGIVRKNFADTAFWQANLVTDKKGEARATINIPDNLTTWRATVRACTMDTAVGECTSSCICSKDLLIRLETPRFLIQKDQAIITALVHNYLPAEQKVVVRLDAPSLEINGRLSTTISVPSRGIKRVQWRVTAHSIGPATLTAYATCTAESDAMQLTIPIRPNGQRQTTSLAGTVSNGSVTEKITLNRNAVPRASEIRVRLSPSVASSLLGSLDYLAAYPYGCTEQTMSCFLPDVVIWRALKSLGIRNPELEKSLPNMVGAGLNRLYDFQRGENGGWGWCEYGETNLWMTSYVVFGLITAQSSGFDISKDVLKNGINAIESQLNNDKDVQNVIYALYVLSLAGKVDTVKTRIEPLLKTKTDQPRELAYIAMTLDNIGEKEQAKHYLSKLWDKSIRSNSRIHWNSEDMWYWEVPTEATAVALMAVIQLTPDDPRIPNAVCWLLEHRYGNHWESTRDTAMIIYALSDYLKHNKELQPSFTTTVTINRRKVATLHFEQNTIFQPEKVITIRSADIASNENIIQLTTTGTGTLYYTIELTQYIEGVEPSTKSRGSGITITREYRKMASGKKNASKAASTEFHVGDTIQVRLTVNSPKNYEHVLIEDYLPAGCEAFDRGKIDYYEIRAGVQGSFNALPTLVQPMYQPNITASGATRRIRIK
jgi:uncharacterized protein YfaS (alpha-2-macroglobulin family)